MRRSVARRSIVKRSVVEALRRQGAPSSGAPSSGSPSAGASSSGAPSTTSSIAAVCPPHRSLHCLSFKDPAPHRPVPRRFRQFPASIVWRADRYSWSPPPATSSSVSCVHTSSRASTSCVQLVSLPVNTLALVPDERCADERLGPPPKSPHGVRLVGARRAHGVRDPR